MKYVNQNEFPHLLYRTRPDPDDPSFDMRKVTTVSTSGCGLCSAVMAADRLLPDFKFDLEDALALAYECGANLGGGTARSFFPAFAGKLGLKLEISDAIEDVIGCVSTGGAAIVLVGGDRDGEAGLFTHGGHYMTVVSQEADGRLAILDPGLYPRKFEEEGRRGKVEVKNGAIVLCPPRLLHHQAATRQPGAYFLFHRK